MLPCRQLWRASCSGACCGGAWVGGAICSCACSSGAAVVAPSVMVLVAVVPAASGRCHVPASDVGPQRLAPSGNAIGCSSTRHWLRRSPVDAQLTCGPAAMRRDLLGGIVVLAKKAVITEYHKCIVILLRCPTTASHEHHHHVCNMFHTSRCSVLVVW